MTRHEIRLCGFGGQGIALAGKILGSSFSFYGNRHSVTTQSYGPESRGGAARSEVIISNETIDYPKVVEADILVLLSQPAYDKYLAAVKPDSTVIVDSDLVNTNKNNIYSVPFTKIADDLGRKVVANSVMLGYLSASTEAISAKSLRNTIRGKVPQHTIDLNIKAFNEGRKLWKNRKKV